MSKTCKLINNLNEKYKLYFNEIDEKISKLEDEREVIQSNYDKDLIETGKSIDLNDVNIHMNNFELLIEGFIIEHGFNESDLNNDFLNLLTISFYLSNNKKDFSKSIEESFLKLSEKSKLYFCLFIPEHIEYKNYVINSSLITNKYFKFLSDYLINEYSLFHLVVFNLYSKEEYQKLKENSFFHIIINKRDVIKNDIYNMEFYYEILSTQNVEKDIKNAKIKFNKLKENIDEKTTLKDF